MTHQEEIMRAVAILVKREGKLEFSREDIRKKLNLDRDTWLDGYTVIFQQMRLYQPTGIGQRFRGVFRTAPYGRHALTEYGKHLVDGMKI